MRRVWLIVALVATAASAPFALQQPAEAELPKTTRKALDELFDKWQVASLDPRLGECQSSGNTSGGAAPSAVVEGDFNDDGVADAAVAVKSSKGVRLAVVFTRLKEGIAMDVDALGDAAADGFLGVARRGQAYRNVEDRLDNFFAADTVTVSRCGRPRTAYLWMGFGFRRIVLE